VFEDKRLADEAVAAVQKVVDQGDGPVENPDVSEKRDAKETML
jgi:hypothetical protein